MTTPKDDEERYFQELLALLIEGKVGSKKELKRAKLQLARRYKVSQLPTDAAVLERVPEEERANLEPLLRTKAVRSISGVAVVAAMTSPAQCPHGRCYYCPGGVDSGTAQSYTGLEPAARRASMNDFVAYRQVKARLEQLRAIGHPIDKIDLIIMGGTFTGREIEYQGSFIKGCFDAMNGQMSPDLTSAVDLNEKAPSRCIGLTIETRPDHFQRPDIVRCMDMGQTRVELGVQTTYDNVLEAMERGHGVQAAIEANGRARDAGLKIGFHMMPGMPGVDEDMDLRTFERLFTDPGFMPDMLKIYPCLVIKGTKLYDLWKKGDYEPLTTEQATSLLAKAKARFPKWVRVLRIQRDIPVQLIEAGVDKSNLRQIIQERMAEHGTRCRCIRCREVGHRVLKGDTVDNGSIELVKENYAASGGTEHFLSFEDTKNDILISYLRLRMPSEWWRPETEGGAFVRELKVIGPVVPLGKRDPEAWQHAGQGQRLLKRAEELCVDKGVTKLLVTSGAGVRDYYRQLGYSRQGPYMEKDLKDGS